MTKKMLVPQTGEMMECLCIGMRHRDGLTTSVEWIPIPEGMTAIDFGRKFFRSFDVVDDTNGKH